jgi:hypothetical protein
MKVHYNKILVSTYPVPYVFEKKFRIGYPNQHTHRVRYSIGILAERKIIGLIGGILLLYCPPWLGLKSKRRGLLSMNLVETVSFRNWGCLSKIK